jgi:hypothetical protein
VPVLERFALFLDYLRRLGICFAAMFGVLLLILGICIFQPRLSFEGHILVIDILIAQAALFMVLDWKLPDQEYWESQRKFYWTAAFMWFIFMGSVVVLLVVLTCVAFALIATFFAKRIATRGSIF